MDSVGFSRFADTPIMTGVLALALLIAVALALRQGHSNRKLAEELRVARQRAPGLEPLLEQAATEVSDAPAHAGAEASDAMATRARRSEHELFSFAVSHDLRAPLRAVEGFTKIVKEDFGHLLDRTGNDHLDRVLDAAKQMNLMIDAMLALSQLASQPLLHQPVDLSQFADAVADGLRRASPEREVRIEIEPGMQVQGDPALLRMVVEQLLGNAWKYTVRAAQAHITFARDPRAADAFTVRDNGVGFDMRYADRLFGLFQRLHSAKEFPGIGGGLASARCAVRRHGGELSAEAEVNRGARFCFSLPQRAAPRTGA